MIFDGVDYSGLNSNPVDTGGEGGGSVGDVDGVSGLRFIESASHHLLHLVGSEVGELVVSVDGVGLDGVKTVYLSISFGKEFHSELVFLNSTVVLSVLGNEVDEVELKVAHGGGSDGSNEGGGG